MFTYEFELNGATRIPHLVPLGSIRQIYISNGRRFRTKKIIPSPNYPGGVASGLHLIEPLWPKQAIHLVRIGIWRTQCIYSGMVLGHSGRMSISAFSLLLLDLSQQDQLLSSLLGQNHIHLAAKPSARFNELKPCSFGNKQFRNFYWDTPRHL